jgi:hypothetical protein
LLESKELAIIIIAITATIITRENHNRVADLSSPPSLSYLLHKAGQSVQPAQIDDINDSRDINPGPKRPCYYNPTATTTSLLLE